MDLNHDANERLPDLKMNNSDYLSAIAKGVVGSCPYVGPIISEAIGTLIPNQRVDRIAKFVKELDHKVSNIDKEIIRNRMLKEEIIDLLEDAMIQATRALTDERIEYIASVIKNSICSTELSHLEEKKVLNLLNSLNDAELIILQYYGLNPVKQKEFSERHKDVVVPPRAHLSSSQEEVDKASIHSTYRSHLEELGLIKPQYGSLKKNELPDFDALTGKFKARHYSITNLGSLMLRKLDLYCSY